MKYIFLIASFNAFFFTVLLFQKRSRAVHDHILILWLIYLGLFIGAYAFYSHHLFTRFNLLSISLISPLMLHGPFLYVYVQALAAGRRHLPWHTLLHLLPFVLFNIYVLISSFSPGASERLNIENLSLKDSPPLVFLFFLALTVSSGTVYFFMTIRLFRKLDINIFNNYSSYTGIHLTWLRILVMVFGIIWTAAIIITIIHHVLHMFSLSFCTDGLFLTLSVFVILIGYFGLRQKVIFTSEDFLVTAGAPESQSRYSGSRLTGEEARQYAEKLTAYMKTYKPYLNPDLTLSQLASGLGVSIHLLSQVINEQLGVNFFNFVNQYRVEEFKERLADPSNRNFSLLGIAFDSGFNSKSTFNRIFRNTTGLTPSRYRESLKQ